MITIYLLRHGETEENARGIFQGQNPGTLSSKGKEQARLLRDKVAGLDIDFVFCSDLKRCRDTAAIVLEGTGLVPVYTKLLRERDMGNLVGKPIAGAHFDGSVENAAQVRKRISQFVERIKSEYSGKTLLIISHGYFCKLFQAWVEQKKDKDVPELDNCEIRRIVLI